MVAYAALASLLRILDTVLEPGGPPISHVKSQLHSLHEKVRFLLDFHENSLSCGKRNESAVESLETKIRDAAYEAGYILESHISMQLLAKPEYKRSSLSSYFDFIFYLVLAILYSNAVPVLIHWVLIVCIQLFMSVIHVKPISLQSLAPVGFHNLIFVMIVFTPFIVYAIAPALFFYPIDEVTYVLHAAVYNVIWFAYRFWLYQELRPVIYDISRITEEVIKIKNACGAGEDLLHRNVLPTSSLSRRDMGGFGKNVVVGFDSDLIEIKTRLTSHSSKTEAISIVGMGGIGKTTLAREVYDCRSIVDHFDTCGWVTISQDYSLRQVLLCLIETAGELTEEMSVNSEEQQLTVCLHKSLKGRRYLIIMDDIWDTEIWDSVKASFPDDNNGSRVVLTTRLKTVALYAGSLHQMRFLNQDESWKLLCIKVFGEKDCPNELEGIGKEITRKCEGLPLAVAVIGGLLSKVSRATKTWESVADNLSSIVSKDEEQCMEILSLSYSHLPHHLRACFLYMGVFREDYEISIPNLIRLWAAEGFLRPSQEELGEEYVEDLIGRNLILVRKRSFDGKIKTCNIHDLLRNLCIQNARKENFIRVIDYYDNTLEDGNSPRILSVRLHDGFPISGAHSFLLTGPQLSTVWGRGNLPFYLGDTYRLLRVLDLLMITFMCFQDGITDLVHLRYLALTYNDEFPPSISKLSNLQTLVYHIDKDSSCPNLPVEIWMMPNLLHLFVTRAYLPDPLVDSFTLENLQALSAIRNFKCCKQVLERIPYLKQLKLFYDVSPSEKWSAYQLEALIHLRELERLKLFIKNPDTTPSSEILYPPKLAFPQKLRKLTLSGCGIPWGSISMMIVGDLKNLQVLKLRRNACRGAKWKPVEAQFCKLKYLLLEEIDLVEWEADESHFPILEHLVIRSCYKLEEIPSGIGEIPTLQMIELVDCHPSALASAKQLQEEQESMGNDELKVVYSEQRLHNKYYKYSVVGQKGSGLPEFTRNRGFAMYSHEN